MLFPTISSFSSRKSRSHSYHFIPPQDEETLLAFPERAVAPRLSIRSNPFFFFDPSFWLTTFAALSVTITIWNLLVVSQGIHVNYVEASIRSPYNGLERLIRNESSPSWPLTSALYPDFVGAAEGQAVHHSLGNGSIVHLDAQRTVIIQHRVRDYGLEHCTAKLEFSGSPEKGSRHAARGYGYIGNGPYLTLWRLEDLKSKAVLTSSALPASLSSPKEFIGNITLDGRRVVQSPSFPCSRGSILTLEIAVACASNPCIMEFQLTRSPQPQGFWLVQSEQKSIPL